MRIGKWELTGYELGDFSHTPISYLSLVHQSFIFPSQWWKGFPVFNSTIISNNQKRVNEWWVVDHTLVTSSNPLLYQQWQLYTEFTWGGWSMIQKNFLWVFIGEKEKRDWQMVKMVDYYQLKLIKQFWDFDSQYRQYSFHNLFQNNIEVETYLKSVYYIDYVRW